MTIELPDVNIGSEPLTSRQARLDFAVGLYSGGHASVGRAAKVAGMPKIPFMQELGKRGIPRHYTAEDVEHDMRMAGELAAKKIAA
jgi:predicted HTH domain antitoxin